MGFKRQEPRQFGVFVSTLGLQVRDADSDSVLVRFHTSSDCLNHFNVGISVSSLSDNVLAESKKLALLQEKHR